MGCNTFSLLKTLCSFLFLVVASATNVCPFNYFYHVGDGFFDVGNAVQLAPNLPATKFPYGMTTPGYPWGRWSDGLLDMDYGGAAFGFNGVTPSLSANASSAVVVFCVAGSPVLDRRFFASKGVHIPSYARSLSEQMKWFKEFFYSTCSKPEECIAKMEKSIFITGDVDANDIGYLLTQGKCIKEVKSYVSDITRAQIHAGKEVLKMGGTRIYFPSNAPLGCYPYILTELGTNNPSDYDKNGCLRKVNHLIRYKNAQLKKRVNRLAKAYPNLFINYADIYTAYTTVLKQSLAGPNRNITLKACCGTEGKYNYDSESFCGTPGVPVCHNPLDYINWDGMHLTQNAHHRLNGILLDLPRLHCTGSKNTTTVS